MLEKRWKSPLLWLLLLEVLCDGIDGTVRIRIRLERNDPVLLGPVNLESLDVPQDTGLIVDIRDQAKLLDDFGLGSLVTSD